MEERRFEQLIKDVTSEVAPQGGTLSWSQIQKIREEVIGRASFTDAEEGETASLDDYRKGLNNAGLSLDKKI